MKTLQKQKLTAVLTVFFISILVSFTSEAQTELKIPDNRNFIVSTGTYLKIPGNITIGNGTSGTFKTNGTNITVTGQLNLNAGSQLNLTSGTFTIGSTNINASSTVIYDGNNQNINNWAYGNLILNGTGSMTVTGDTASPTITRNLTVNNTGNILKIPENRALTVLDTLTNNAGTNEISIESSSLGDGSLISYTENVDATVNRYLTGYRWHYISSPIDSAPLTLFNTNNFMWWDASMDWAGTGDFNPWKAWNTNLENARGYAYYYYDTTIPYEGKINVGDYNITLRMYTSGTLDYQGWNLIGNPYTSVLDWDAAVSGGAVPVGAENAIYFFDDETGDGAQSNYRYYVPSTGGTYGVGTEDANGKIPMGQGFFVKTNTDNVVLSLNKTYRTHAVQTFYKTPSDEYIKLQIAGDKHDETIVRIIDNSTNGFDPDFDARKLFPFDETIPQIYIIGTDYKKTAINSLPVILPNTVIKLGVKASEGEYDIKIKDLNFFKYDVFLVDKQENTYTDLSEDISYKFNYSGGQNENRFFLTFRLPASDIITNLSESIKIYPNPTNRYIKFINNSNVLFESVKINSTDGKICYLNNHPESINEIDLSKLSNGVYFLEIKLSDGNSYRNKIILKK
ncbi:MAG: T9SS type A sorting domain-containing protein [Bacteroidales bacterium]|nr:T9SS type A sorting domain-containing protein [Bacteroidales bacterium]